MVQPTHKNLFSRMLILAIFTVVDRARLVGLWPMASDFLYVSVQSRRCVPCA